MPDLLLPVILCGGAGTRLWPLSRESFPKQFLALTGSATMLQQTALRITQTVGTVAVAEPMVVCNAEHRFIAASQLMEVGIRQPQILLEPAGRNTAPALTLAAIQSMADGADPVLLAMPADHVIADPAAFQAAVAIALPLAASGAMVTFGIAPDRAETGYGYIQRGEVQTGGAYAIESFAEKPDAQTAQRYLDAGDYLWNSGLFMVRASVWLKAMAHCRPDILAACEAAMRGARHDLDFIRPDSDAFLACPADSIDYAVMERLPTTPTLGIAAQVVPLRAGWSDLGAWDALWDISERDADGNVRVGSAMVDDCTDCLVFSSSRLVAAVGLEHIVVVETPDAVLVVDKSRTQEVKKIVARLHDAGNTLAHTHRKVHRPWGWYDSIDSGERFQVKRIVVNPGARLSLQMHHHRAEHWIVVKGTAQVTKGDQVFLLGENESTYIPVGHRHRLENPGRLPLEMIEVQSGSYLGEDDIVRFDDTYGRMTETPADKPPLG